MRSIFRRISYDFKRRLWYKPDWLKLDAIFGMCCVVFSYRFAALRQTGVYPK